MSRQNRPRVVLIVDDDADFRASTKTLLEAYGYEVSTAATGKDGLQAIRDNPPDLLVVDVMMEYDGAGYEVNQAVKFGRDFEALRHIPVVMLFRDELSSLAGVEALNTLLTVDRAPEGGWNHRIGLLPALFDQVTIDPARTYAAVVGPPVVYKFVLAELVARRFPKDRILMSLERRMKCGVGKCGHCSVGYKYTCVHGPVFTYWDAINLPEVV